MSDQFAELFRRRSLRDLGRDSATPDLANRICVLGALFFGAVWWVPSDWSYLHDFLEMGFPHVLYGAVTIFLIVCVIGSVWFFLVQLFCNMAGGKTSIGIATVAAFLPGVAILVKVAIMFIGMFAPATPAVPGGP